MKLQLFSLSILFCYHSLTFSAAAPAEAKYKAETMTFHAKNLPVNLLDYTGRLDFFYRIDPAKPYNTLATHYNLTNVSPIYCAYRIFNDPQKSKGCCSFSKSHIKQLNSKKSFAKFLSMQTDSTSIEIPATHHHDTANFYAISGADSDGVATVVNLSSRGLSGTKGDKPLNPGEAKRALEHLLLTHKATTESAASSSR